jgi:hypothetical protein
VRAVSASVTPITQARPPSRSARGTCTPAISALRAAATIQNVFDVSLVAPMPAIVGAPYRHPNCSYWIAAM